MVVIVVLALEKYVHLGMHISQNLKEIIGRNYLKSLVWIYFENSQKNPFKTGQFFREELENLALKV